MVKPNTIYVDATPKGRVGLVFRRDNKTQSRIVAIQSGLTNNEAEYMGAIKAFNFISPEADWVIVMDSLLVVNQASGVWQCRSPNLHPFFDQLMYNLDNFYANITFRWISRDDNPAGILLERFKDIENGLDKELARELENQPVRKYVERLYDELEPQK